MRKVTTIRYGTTLFTLGLVLICASCSSGNNNTKADQPERPATSAVHTNVVPHERLGPVELANAEEPAPDSSYDRNGDGALSWAELSEGVSAHTAKLDFPQRYQTTADKILRFEESSLPPGTDKESVSYDLGSEESLPGEAHFCAWAYSWIDAVETNDTSAQQDSMTRIREASKTVPSFLYIEAQLTGWLNQAELGDSVDFLWFVDELCHRDIFEIDPPTAMSIAAIRLDRSSEHEGEPTYDSP